MSDPLSLSRVRSPISERTGRRRNTRELSYIHRKWAYALACLAARGANEHQAVAPSQQRERPCHAWRDANCFRKQRLALFRRDAPSRASSGKGTARNVHPFPPPVQTSHFSPGADAIERDVTRACPHSQHPFLSRRRRVSWTRTRLRWLFSSRRHSGCLLRRLIPAPRSHPKTRLQLPSGSRARTDHHRGGRLRGCDTQGRRATGLLLDRCMSTLCWRRRSGLLERHAVRIRDVLQPPWGRHKDKTRPTPGNHDIARRAPSATSPTLARPRNPRGRAITASTSLVAHPLAEHHLSASDGSPQITWIRRDSRRIRLRAHSLTGTTRALLGEHGNLEDAEIWRVLAARAWTSCSSPRSRHVASRRRPRQARHRDRYRQFVVGTGGLTSVPSDDPGQQRGAEQRRVGRAQDDAHAAATNGSSFPSPDARFGDQGRTLVQATPPEPNQQPGATFTAPPPARRSRAPA